MSDRSSRPKDKSAGKRPPEGGAPAEAAGNLEATVILNPATAGLAPDQRVRIPRTELVAPGGETVQIGRPAPEPDGHAEGTMIMPMAIPREPDTLPGIAPQTLAEPMESTQIMPRVPPAEESTLRIAPEDRERMLAGEGTMIMPMAIPAPPEESTVRILPEERERMLAGEGTMIMPAILPPAALVPEVPETRPDLPPPEAGTLRLEPEARERILAGEGTMILPAAALAPEDPDTRPDLLRPPPEERTLRILPEERERLLAGEGTMIMPVAAPAAEAPPSTPSPESPVLESPGPEIESMLEGTLVLPAAEPPVPVEDTPTKPDLQVPPEIRAAGEGTLILHAAEPAAMPTAAEVIQERLAASDARLAGYPHAAPEPAAPLHATPRSVPVLPAELLAPPPPEVEPLGEPLTDETDPESPRATLRVPLKELPERRQSVPVAERLPFEAAPAPILPPVPTEPARFVDEEQLPPAVVEPYRPVPAPRPAATAPAPAATETEGFSPEGQLGTPPGRSFALLWGGVVAAVLLLIGGLWVWNMGWLGGGTASAKPAPPPAPAEGAKLPESMRPAFEKALAGDPNAMRYLGVCYVNGLGVPVDRSEGLKWYRRAAAAGSSAAQQDLLALEAQGVR